MSENTAILLGTGAIAVTIAGASCFNNARVADLRDVMTGRMDSFENRLLNVEDELRTQGATSEGVAAAAAPASDPTADAGPPPYHVYVTNEYSGDLTVIAGGTNEVVATVPLGKRPRGIKVSPDGTQLFVALSGSPPAPPGIDESTLPPPDRSADGIGIVDIAAGEVVNIVRAGTDPEQVAVSADGTRLYVANEDAGEASVVDIATGDILAALPVGGEPEGVRISPDGSVVYVTSEEDNQVSAIDTAANEVVAVFEVGARPRASAFSPDGSRAYVTAENSGTVHIVDTSTHEVIETIQLTGELMRPMGVVVSPDASRVYVTNGRGRDVVVIDAASGEPVAEVEVGDRPWGIGVTPDGRYLYTANGPSNDVSVVDTETMEVIARIPAGERPWGIAIVPAE